MKQSKQVNRTGLVRIDAEWLYHAKLEAVKRRTSVKSLVEEGLELVIENYPSLKTGGRNKQ